MMDTKNITSLDDELMKGIKHLDSNSIDIDEIINLSWEYGSQDKFKPHEFQEALLIKARYATNHIEKIANDMFKDDIKIKINMNDKKQLCMTAYFSKTTLDPVYECKYSLSGKKKSKYKDKEPGKYKISVEYKSKNSKEFIDKIINSLNSEIRFELVYKFFFRSERGALKIVDWISFVKDDLSKKMFFDYELKSRKNSSYEFSYGVSQHSQGFKKLDGETYNRIDTSNKESLAVFFESHSKVLMKNKYTVKSRLTKNGNLVLSVLEKNGKNPKTITEFIMDNKNKRIEFIKDILSDTSKTTNMRFIEAILSFNESKRDLIERCIDYDMQATDGMRQLSREIVDKKYDLVCDDLRYVKDLFGKMVKENEEEYKTFIANCDKSNPIFSIADMEDGFTKFKNIKKEQSFRSVKFYSPLVTILFNRDYKDLNDYQEYPNDANVLKIINTKIFLENVIKNFSTYKEIEEYFLNKKTKTSNSFSKNDFYKFKTFYNAEAKFDCLTIKYSPIENIIKLGKEKIEMTSVEKLKKEIDKFFREMKSSISEEFNSHVGEMKKVFEVEEYKNIIDIIDEIPDKGITTYIDILKGAKNAKIRENSYDKSRAYASLKHMKKSEIEDCINEVEKLGMIDTRVLKASFGRYYAVYVSRKYEEFKDVLNSTIPKDKMTKAYIETLQSEKNSVGVKKATRTIKVKDIKNLDALMSELKREESTAKSKALIDSAKTNIKTLDKLDLNNLLEFIKNHRYAYKEVEEEFINFLVNIIDITLLPMFILQENMVNGVTKEFLSKLVCGLKEKSSDKILA